MSSRALDTGEIQSRPSKRAKVDHHTDYGNPVSPSDQAFWALPELHFPSEPSTAHTEPNKIPGTHVTGYLGYSSGNAATDSHLSLVYGERVPSRQLQHTYDEWDQIEYDPPAGQDERRTSYVDPAKVAEIRARRRKLFDQVLEKVNRDHLDEFAYLCEKLKDSVHKQGKTWKLVLDSEDLKKLADRFKQLHSAEMSQASKDLAILFIQCTGPFAPLKSVASSKLVGPVCLAPMLGNISHEALKKANNTICNRVMSVAGANLFRAQRKFAIFGNGASNKEEKRAGVSKKGTKRKAPSEEGAVQQTAVRPQVGLDVDLDNIQSVVDAWVPPAESEDQPLQQQGFATESLDYLAWLAPAETFPPDPWQDAWITGQDISPDDPLLQLSTPGEASQVQQSWVDDPAFDVESFPRGSLAQLAQLDQLLPEQQFSPEQLENDWISGESARREDPLAHSLTQDEENQAGESPFTGGEY